MSKFTYLAAPFINRANTKIGTVRLAFDLESDGLLAEATKIHCVVVADLDSDQIDEFGPDQIGAALAHLARADYLVGHNITGFDLPLLRRLHGWAPSSGCAITDTLVASRLILPNLSDLDDQAVAMGDRSLGKLRGRYSIEAWGARLGMSKIGAGIEDWSKWTPEMQERCAGDVVICKALWKFLAPDGYSKQAMELEHRTAAICNQITADGVPFDTRAAEQLRQQWTARRSELEAQLSQQFPGSNLNSRAQIGALLEARGWVPEKRTEKTKQPKIDDELLETIPTIYPEFAGLAEHYTLDRRLGQLADGDKAWLKHVGKDGRIHGAIVHIGTPHSRAAHFNPNLAQVPNPKRGKPLAAECRALFHHDGDWVFIGCDQAGLQDRCFSHYLAAFDNGDYGRSFIAGDDTHWKSATALELVSPGTERDKTSNLHTALREGSKSFRYGFLFGMGAKRAGEIITAIVRAARQIDPSYQGPSTNGGRALQRFEAATPGLRQLRQGLEVQAARNAWVLGLEGRRVPTGAQYKALNRIVTSAEAIICKRWLINVYDELCARFRYGWNGNVVITAWVHDELVICCRPEIAKEIGEIMLRHAREAGEFYELKVPLDAEYKIGSSWAGDAPTKTIEEFRAPTSTSQSILDHNDEKTNSAVEKRANGAGNKIICPFHDDHSPSLEMYADGHYHCYVCQAHGDIEDLPEAPPLVPKAPENKTDTLQRAARLWDVTIPIHGTLAERYLIETRKLDLTLLPNIDAVLRFHPNCPFNGNNHPCVVARFSDCETDEPAGIHRIALTADAEKIDRMMLGSWPRARAIKLRPTGKKLIVGEGIETTIAGGMRLGDEAVALWALGSANAIGQLPVVADVGELVILVDREKSGAGLSNAHAWANRWYYAKRKTALLIPQQDHADFNDLVLEGKPL